MAVTRKTTEARIKALEYLVELALAKRGSSSISSGETILWDPTQATSGQRVHTWAEVMAAIASSVVPINLITSVSALAPVMVPAGVHDMKYATITALFPDPGFGGILSLSDGAVIANIGHWGEGLEIIGNSVTPGNDAIRFDWANRPDPWFRTNGELINVGTEPMIQVPTGKDLIIEPFGSLAPLGSDQAHPIVNLNGTSTVTLYLNNMPIDGLADNWVTGDAPSGVFYYNDGSLPVPLPSIPGFLGTVTNTGVQSVGGAGITTDRPIANYANVSYFDKTLGKPIFWDGTQYVDATGAPV